jgi:periplasmic copper chaperone A
MSSLRSARFVFIFGALVLAAGAVACGSDDDDAAGTTTTAAAAEPVIEVSDAWCRTSPAQVNAGACYMEISNTGGGEDALTAASVDATVAASTELHETIASGADDMGTEEPTTTMADGEGAGATMGGTDGGMGNGMVEMRQVPRITIPSGGTVSLEPGGYHVMLLELAEPLTEGATVTITLTFETAESRTVEAQVRAS